MLTVTGCQTCLPDPEIEEYLTVEFVPDLIPFDPDNPELKKILTLQVNIYYWCLDSLNTMKETGLYVSENIDEEIQVCHDNIKWIEDILDKIKSNATGE